MHKEIARIFNRILFVSHKESTEEDPISTYCIGIGNSMIDVECFPNKSILISFWKNIVKNQGVSVNFYKYSSHD